MSEVSAAEYADIATMWQRGFVRCMLSGDGVTYRLTVLDGGQVVRRIVTSDELRIISAAEAFLREHEQQRGSTRRARQW